MTKVIVGMAISLDGLIQDRNGSVGRLYPDMDAMRASEALQDDKLTFTFVTDGVESAIRQARAAAGGRNVVVVGGANTIQQLLRAGLADELHLDVRPVLLGEGLRLLEHLGTPPPALEYISVSEGPLTADLRLRVVK